MSRRSNMDSDGVGSSIVLGRSELLRIRAEALRRGMWFKVLTQTERAMVDLAIKVVRGFIKGAMLAHLMRAVVAKLREAIESRFTRMVRENGRPLAARISRIAVAWGNRSAFLWSHDITFARYLAVLHMNLPEAPS